MPRPRSDIKPRIVEAARARFLSRGVDGASLREIARDAGTNIGMIVYYFPTKDDLFLAVVEEVYAKLLADIERILRTVGPVRERLLRAFVRLGSASGHEAEVVRLMAREALSSSARLRRIVARFRRGHIPLVIETIFEGIGNGEFDATVPAPLIVMAVIGLGPLPQVLRRVMHGLPLFAALPGPEKLAALSIELLFRAVGAPAPSAKPRRRRTKAPRD